MPLKTPYTDRTTKVIALTGVVLAGLALVGVLLLGLRPPTTSPSTRTAQARMRRIASTGVLRVGYGAYPPYTIYDSSGPNPEDRIKGFSIDLVKEIARRAVPPLKIEWQQFSWDTLKGDMEKDKFDMIADPVFMTIPRAMDFTFSRPYSYFGIAVGLVRKGDTRFKQFSDLDRSGITVALAEGWTSSEYARQHLSKPTLKGIAVTGDAHSQLDEVRLGHADIALNDIPTVLQYANAYEDKVQALWVDAPPSRVPGAFMLRAEDLDLKTFLDEAIEIVVADRILESLDQKWKTFGFFPLDQLRPAIGFSESEKPDRRQ